MSALLSDLHDQAAPFARRHIGPDANEKSEMLAYLGYKGDGCIDTFIADVVPQSILGNTPIDLPQAIDETEALNILRSLAEENQNKRSFIGCGYYRTITPTVIRRNLMENPGWYTSYTPYQAEIAQGRLESLLNFQTMIGDLTGLPISNCSLLDEGTAAAEALQMAHSIQKGKNKRETFFIDRHCHPQSIDVIRTRSEALGWNCIVGDFRDITITDQYFAVILQYPATDGGVRDYGEFITAAHEQKCRAIVAADLLALTLLTPPGEFGADIVVGSSQRFGVPMMYGGPHAAFLATTDELKRLVPGRIIGVSKDKHGAPALRMALQTREQHIRRERATSNICTAQALLANMAAMYAVYHGPDGLRAIASRVHTLACSLAEGLRSLKYGVGPTVFFDTLRVDCGGHQAEDICKRADAAGMNFRLYDSQTICISIDECSTPHDIDDILRVFNDGEYIDDNCFALSKKCSSPISENFIRTSPFLRHPVFNSYHSETEMMRYLKRLEDRDLSLKHSMIPLGSCTMKLNAGTEMEPVSWPGFADIHPFAPRHQVAGYQKLIQQLEQWLSTLTGFDAVSLQPNAGSQGEYAGLLAIAAYHRSRGEERNICLIPTSAHGTNPASAVMAGMKVVAVACDENGNISLDDLKTKCEKHKDNLGAFMITYPSTHGVFEEDIIEICDTVHTAGGQVYMDGANMNAQTGLCSPGAIGADVCHLNLHKTFAIPHGGGGPGVGPIGVKRQLVPFLPKHGVVAMDSKEGHGPIAAAPWGSAGILPISWAYIAMLGKEGVTEATRVAILNANYVAKRLHEHFPVLYTGRNGFVAHECIIDLRPLKTSCGIEAEDVAKRLIDYGYHSPTMSFPVAGTLMIEPTESESLAELDRFCDAMIAIRQEIARVESGELDAEDNMLKHAPHTAAAIAADDWSHSYAREEAAFPLPWIEERKFWPKVGRIDNVWGDKNLVCSCVGMEEYAEAGVP